MGSDPAAPLPDPIITELRRLRADWLKALGSVEPSNRSAIEKCIALIDKVLAGEIGYARKSGSPKAEKGAAEC